MFKRFLTFVHRWLGAAVATMLMLWFSSGIVMMYHGFPEVSVRDRLTHARDLDRTALNVSPEQAAIRARQPGVAPVRIATFDGRPVYLFPGAVVYADTGAVQSAIDVALLGRVAAEWSRQPLHLAHREALTTPDQWTTGGEFQFLFPMHKFSWPDGQEVYVRDEDADILQYTTTSSRRWAYLGAIPHWLYFAALRQHSNEWFGLMKWTAIVATASGVIGLVLGVWVYSPRRRYRHNGLPSRIPYRDWKRWHTAVGLVFGVITITWSFSGLLSMGPFRFMEQLTAATVPSDDATDKTLKIDKVLLSDALPLAAYAGTPPAQAIASVHDFTVKEIDYVSLDGVPLYIASDATAQTRVIPVAGYPAVSFEPADLMRHIARANAGDIADVRLLTEYDRHYLDRRGNLPLPVICVTLNDAVGSRYYIDPKTASIVDSQSVRGWVHRWLFHGMHSLNFPWLYKHRPLWDLVMITLLLGGSVLSTTSLMLTARLVARKARGILHRLRHTQPARIQPQGGRPA